jgi:hypothetical protein
MPSKLPKKKRFDVVAAVKSNARDRIGTPRESFIIPSKKNRPSKYKKKVSELIENPFDDERNCNND